MVHLGRGPWGAADAADRAGAGPGRGTGGARGGPREHSLLVTAQPPAKLYYSCSGQSWSLKIK